MAWLVTWTAIPSISNFDNKKLEGSATQDSKERGWGTFTEAKGIWDQINLRSKFYLIRKEPFLDIFTS